MGLSLLYSKRLQWNPPHMPSSLCSVGECILSIISHCNLQTNLEPWGGSVTGRKGLGSFLIQTALPSPRLHSDYLCGKTRQLLFLKSGLHGRDRARQWPSFEKQRPQAKRQISNESETRHGKVYFKAPGSFHSLSFR